MGRRKPARDRSAERRIVLDVVVMPRVCETISCAHHWPPFSLDLERENHAKVRRFPQEIARGPLPNHSPTPSASREHQRLPPADARPNIRTRQAAIHASMTEPHADQEEDVAVEQDDERPHTLTGDIRTHEGFHSRVPRERPHGRRLPAARLRSGDRRPIPGALPPRRAERLRPGDVVRRRMARRRNRAGADHRRPHRADHRRRHLQHRRPPRRRVHAHTARPTGRSAATPTTTAACSSRSSSRSSTPPTRRFPAPRTRRSAARRSAGCSRCTSGCAIQRRSASSPCLSPSVWWDDRVILREVEAIPTKAAAAHLARRRAPRRRTGDRRRAAAARRAGRQGMDARRRPDVFRGRGRRAQRAKLGRARRTGARSSCFPT